MPDTFAQSHITSTASNAGAAADKVTCSKTKKYEHLSITHNFIPVALETGGSWNSEAIAHTNDIGKRITAINSEPLETQFLFQQISIAVQRGNAWRSGTHPQMTITFQTRETHSIEHLT